MLARILPNQKIHCKPIIRHRYTNSQITAKPTAILIGATGSGKTTLQNKICLSNLPTGIAEDSVTKMLITSEVTIGKQGFTLIDTPGNDGKEDSYTEAQRLRKGLTDSYLNSVFIMVKFEARLNKIIKSLKKQLRLLKGYEDTVVLIISHWDLSSSNLNQKETEHAIFEQICKIIDENKCAIANIISYSMQQKREEIATLMQECAAHMKKLKINISEEEFLMNFNVFKVNMACEREQKNFKDECTKIMAKFMQALTKLPNQSNEDKNDIIFALINSFKEQVRAMHDNFQQKQENYNSEIDFFNFAIKLQKRMQKLNDLFIEKSKEFLKCNYKGFNDIRNQIKKCPKCGEIWWLVEGDENMTRCGNPPNEQYDKSEKKENKFEVSNLKGSIIWTKNELPKAKVNESNVIEKIENSVYRGCGAELDWKKLPPLPEEDFFKFFQVKTIDEAKEIIQIDYFDKLRKKHEKDLTYWEENIPQKAEKEELKLNQQKKESGGKKIDENKGNKENEIPVNLYEKEINVLMTLGIKKTEAIKTLIKANGNLENAFAILWDT